MLEKTLETPLDCKVIQPVYPKAKQSWIFIGRTDAEAEAPVLWRPDPKSWLTRKDPDAGKDWRQEEKGMTEDKMVGRHHRLNGHEFEQILGDSEGQGSMVCCSSWGHRVRYELVSEQWKIILIIFIWSKVIFMKFCIWKLIRFLLYFSSARYS